MATIAITGGGLVGLATAWHLARAGHRPVVLEKEREVARHQSGRNSGVVHSGLYYRPGSLKARFATEGNREIAAFATERGIAYERCGKVVVASTPEEVPRLEGLAARAAENEVEALPLDGEALAAREPHARAAAALLVPSTGIVDYPAIARALADETAGAGGEVRVGAEVAGIAGRDGGVVIRLADGTTVAADLLVNCAGLHADRVARLAGVDPPVRIVPFRGEYWRLVPAARGLVRHMIYPVPDPALPFLGVHLHRMTSGEVYAGPNAVLAGRREGYRRRDLSPRDLAEALAYPGFWRLARRFPAIGFAEVWRSLSKRRFVASLRQLVPEIAGADLLPATAGVRAQALAPDGTLVDDFLVVERERAIHVLNAPSPAATSCLPIGRHLATLAAERLA